VNGADLFVFRYTSHSENFARKDLPLGLTWSLLRNDAGLKNLVSKLDDFFHGRRIGRLIAKSPGLNQSAVFNPPFSAGIIAFVRWIGPTPGQRDIESRV
jgi:hypothetical protein